MSGGSAGRRATRSFAGRGRSFSFGALPNVPFGQEGAGSGLWVRFISGDVPRLEVPQVLLTSVTASDLRTTRLATVEVAMRAGVLSVDFDGKARVHNLTVPLWAPIPGGGLGSAPGRALR